MTGSQREASIWITGASGQIGSALCRALEARGKLVSRISRAPDSIDDGKRYLPWSVFDCPGKASGLEEPDAIVHLASQTSAYLARDEPRLDAIEGIGRLLSIIEFARSLKHPPHVVLVGSATEVGITKSGVVGDSDVDDPLTFYDVGKVAQRLYLIQADRERWLDATTIRVPNVYGGVVEHQNERGFLNQAVSRALRGEDLHYYDDGSFVRDFLYVGDAVEALYSALQQRESVAGKTFVIGSGVGTSIRDALRIVGEIVGQLTGKRIDVNSIPAPEGVLPIERRDAVVSSSKFRSATGWSPSTDLRQGLEKLITELLV